MLSVALSGGVAYAGNPNFPETIDLPDPTSFAGEGVATGTHSTFYAGSRLDGWIARGDLRSGTSEVFIDEPIVPTATGLKADLRHGLLWVAGAQTGKAAVYDLETGDPVVALTLTTANSFVNDVVVTRARGLLHRQPVTGDVPRVPVADDGTIGVPKRIVMSGAAADAHVPGAFNLNGIEATGNGRTLIAVNSTLGTLYTMDKRRPASATRSISGAPAGADRRRRAARGRNVARTTERRPDR